MGKYIDLHIHSTYSDGEMNPETIVDIAKKNNVETIAIADHDDLRGSKKLNSLLIKNINFINAIELSTITKIDGKDKKIHILGYGMDFDNDKLETVLEDKRKLRESSNKKYIYSMQRELLFLKKDTFESIEFDRYMRFDRLILECIEKFNYTINELERIKNYLIHNKFNYPNYDFIDFEAIKLIEQANGIPVLAHPYQYNINETQERALIERLKKVGLQGIETCHSGDSITGMQMQKNLANEYNLLESLGSDFHTKENDSNNQIGLGKNKNLCKSTCSVLEKLKEKNKVYRK